ncbi:hypothetical protein [Actinophytocola sp.]|uniref:hypothetical protein n=1 Tax=Actinophytocola sp. TaxID=1872138 RepID=UPI002ED685E9
MARTGGAPERTPVTGNPVTMPFDTRAEIDPCSLTGPAAFEPHGTATMPGRPDMDNCRVSVATDAGRAFVWLGEQMSTSMLPRDRTQLADLGRGATIVLLEDGCDMALVLAEGFAVTAFSTSADDGDLPEVLLCSLNRGALTGVFNVLAGERAKLWRPAPNSLATLSPCDVMSRGLVAEQLDIPSDVEPVFPITGHWCRWGEDDGNQATLRYPVAESASELGVPDGHPTEVIADRESWVVAGRISCTVYAKHIDFAIGVGTFEFAELGVTMPDVGKPGAGDPCAAARTLADAAWRHLPPVT